jgi:ABC-type transport system involved in cytochrome c biogenesis permease component
LETQFGELLAVERYVRGDAADGFLQSVKLQPLQRITIERFALLVPKHGQSGWRG